MLVKNHPFGIGKPKFIEIGSMIGPKPVGQARGFSAANPESSWESFYLSTVTETGWPYIQHRGGSPGFLRVTGPQSLAFADYQGNRQLITTGSA